MNRPTTSKRSSPPPTKRSRLDESRIDARLDVALGAYVDYSAEDSASRVASRSKSILDLSTDSRYHITSFLYGVDIRSYAQASGVLRGETLAHGPFGGRYERVTEEYNDVPTAEQALAGYHGRLLSEEDASLMRQEAMYARAARERRHPREGEFKLIREDVNGVPIATDVDIGRTLRSGSNSNVCQYYAVWRGKRRNVVLTDVEDASGGWEYGPLERVFVAAAASVPAAHWPYSLFTHEDQFVFKYDAKTHTLRLNAYVDYPLRPNALRQTVHMGSVYPVVDSVLSTIVAVMKELWSRNTSTVWTPIPYENSP